MRGVCAKMASFRVVLRLGFGTTKEVVTKGNGKQRKRQQRKSAKIEVKLPPIISN